MADLLKSLEKQRGSGRVAFLACRDEVVKALRKGYKAKEIWRALCDEEAMPIGYEGFMRHVRKLPEYQVSRRQKESGAEATPTEPLPGKPKRVTSGKQPNFSLRPDPENVENLMRTSE